MFVVFVGKLICLTGKKSVATFSLRLKKLRSAARKLLIVQSAKVGDVFTERQVAAVKNLFPDLDNLKEQTTTIKFANGKPYVEGENKLGIRVDGKELLSEIK